MMNFLAVFPIPELSAKSTGIPKKLLISSFISFILLIALKPYLEAKSGVDTQDYRYYL
jgi:membrane-associated HD superfamily phosphohydrolase